MNNEDQDLTYDATLDQTADVAPVEPVVADDAVVVDEPVDEPVEVAEEAVMDAEVPAEDMAAVEAATDTVEAEVPELPAVDTYGVPTEPVVAEPVAEEVVAPAADDVVTNDVATEAGIQATDPAAPVEAPAIALDPASALERVASFLSGVFYLATADGDQPRVRPFDSAVLDGGKIYFATQKSKPVYSQMIANPKVEIFAMPEGEGVLRIACQVVENTDPVVTKALLEKAGKYTGNDDLTTFYLTNIAGQVSGVDGKSVDITL